jgi:hypothetical protein
MTSLETATTSSIRLKRKRKRGRSLTVRKNATNAKSNENASRSDTGDASTISSRPWERLAIFGGSAWGLVLSASILGISLGFLLFLNHSNGRISAATGVKVKEDPSLWSRLPPSLGSISGLEHATNHQDDGWPRRDCLIDKYTFPALYPGDLNKLFQDIAANYSNSNCSAMNEDVTVTVHSGSNEMFGDLPWILTLDNFLSREECDVLVNLGREQGFERSMDVVQPKKHDKATQGKITVQRTSESAWCTTAGGCRDQELPRRLEERISDLVGIPKENSEDLQILKYNVGHCTSMTGRGRYFAQNSVGIGLV